MERYSNNFEYDKGHNNLDNMKAIVCTKYGSPDVFQLQDVAKPAPKDNEVLIRLYAVNYGWGM